MEVTASIDIDNVLEIAMALEDQGAAFYAAAASFVSEPAPKKLFQALVRAEHRHKEIFEAMRERVRWLAGNPEDPDPDGFMADFLKGWTQRKVFDGEDPERFVRDKTIREIITKAISLEEEAIDFYQGLWDLLPEGDQSLWLDKIIDQERRHRRGLERVLERLCPA